MPPIFGGEETWRSQPYGRHTTGTSLTPSRLTMLPTLLLSCEACTDLIELFLQHPRVTASQSGFPSWLPKASQRSIIWMYVSRNISYAYI